ncbi:ABC transporter ATP-binding protein [Mycobacterium sp. TY815]|uniref:ABC transporter ATP-binding protein n=1 Tax=Mycobacterium sp. TY815 TaxID=3050581 RepID=UPI000FC23D6C|nr:ABC transporter ATP-binding protein [Mycobacterium sp. TY815]MDP7702254.1 ABC transporter ATP-binding protein [Mycobacterium sp. TY815]RUP03383.1 MAG: ABC transporter ATP-binding protein [Mycobacterium sp.]
MAPAKSFVADDPRMISLLRVHWVSMTVSLFLLGVATALSLLQPLLIGRLVDRASAGTPIFTLAVLLVIMLVGQLLAEASGHYRLGRIGAKIVLQVRAVFTSHVVRLPIGLLDGTRTGTLLARATSDASLLREMPRAVSDVFFGALTLLGAVIFMLTIDALTVGIVVVAMGLAFAAGNPFLSRIQRASLNCQAALGDYTAGLERALGAARTIKLYGAEDREAQSIGGSAHAAYEYGVRIAASTAMSVLVFRLGVTGSFVAIMIIDGQRVADGTLAVGQFVSLFAFALYAIFPVTAAFVAFTNVRIAAGAHQHLIATLHELPEGDQASLAVAGGVNAPSASEFSAEDENSAPLVEFDHVSFSYGNDPVLDDVSFTLLRDQTTALIGPSGAGKSTILALLCRFHDPSSGTVSWEGRDFRSIGLKELRGRLGLLEQDAPVLHGTVRDNLLIADPDAGDADLWRVLEQANIADEIARLPEQLDTPVLERGRGLSGGQRQRLALARALLSRSQLILMDEPTAHLDRANEYDVMNNLLQARGHRSLLVVAHRLSTVTNADQILVLRHGRIYARGTHAELLGMPVYRELIEHELASH